MKTLAVMLLCLLADSALGQAPRADSLRSRTCFPPGRNRDQQQFDLLVDIRRQVLRNQDLLIEVLRDRGGGGGGFGFAPQQQPYCPECQLNRAQPQAQPQTNPQASPQGLIGGLQPPGGYQQYTGIRRPAIGESVQPARRLR